MGQWLQEEWIKVGSIWLNERKNRMFLMRVLSRKAADEEVRGGG